MNFTKNQSKIITAVTVVITLSVILLIIKDIFSGTVSRTRNSALTPISIYSCFENSGAKSVALAGMAESYTTDRAPETDIVISSVTPEQFYTKLNADFTYGCAADIIIAPPSYDIAQLYKNGYIANIASEFKSNPEWSSKFDRSILKFVSASGTDGAEEIYGLPVNIEYVLLFCNNNIFKNCGITNPKSYADLKLAVSELAARGITPIAMGADDHEMYLYQALAAMLDNSGKIPAISDGAAPPQYSSAFERLSGLADLHAFPADYKSLTRNDAQKMFLNGTAAMIVESSSFVNEITQYANSADIDYHKYIDSIDIIAFPTETGSRVQYNIAVSSAAYNAGDFTIFINQRAYKERRAAIMNFIKYITSPEVLRSYLAQTNDIMAIKDIENKEYKIPLIAKCKLAAENASKLTYMPINITYRDIWFSQIRGNLPQMLDGAASADEVFSSLARLTEINARKKESEHN